MLWIGFIGAASIATLGGVPALYAWQLRKRRKKYEGTIRSIPAAHGVYTIVKYEFEVGGGSYRGYMPQPGEMTRYWSDSDTVAILHDSDNPSESCIVYR